MCWGRKSKPLIISISLCLLFFALVIQLICHEVHCNYTTAGESVVTLPSTHRVRRQTTSPVHADNRQNANGKFINSVVTKGFHFNSLDIFKLNQTSNASASTMMVSISVSRPVSIATIEKDAMPLAGEMQVPEHVTNSPPTTDSQGHVTNTTNHSTSYSTETGNSLNNPQLLATHDDVITTSSHDSKTVTQNVLLEEPSNNLSPSEDVLLWQSWTTNVEPESLQYTVDNDKDFSNQLMTSSNRTARHNTHFPADKDEEDINSMFTSDIDVISLEEERSVVVLSCICGMLTSLLFVVCFYCLRDCSLRRLCHCLSSTCHTCCCCCCQHDVTKCDGESLLLHGNYVTYDVTVMT